MLAKVRMTQFLVCDDNAFTRRLVMDVLSGAGFERVAVAGDGRELLELTVRCEPRVVITSSRIPGMSGLEFTRTVRGGYGTVNRATSIIVMSDTPTQKFLDAARGSGVDEMLLRPFTGQALLVRVEAVLLRPRRFVKSVSYVGPCRRRRMLEEYGGPLRRLSDPLADSDKPPWEAEANAALVRQCVARLTGLLTGFAESDKARLREIHTAVKETEQLAQDICDQSLLDAVRSLLRYMGGVGVAGPMDPLVLNTHVAAMQQLSALGADHLGERQALVQGLVKVVDKRLGKPSPARVA
ncbi:MAG: response regulator [Hyphomonadaceae bacterium]|nr:response regulator [Hyphomonadaceae bacterium]